MNNNNSTKSKTLNIENITVRTRIISMIAVVGFAALFFLFAPTAYAADKAVEIWWPAENAKMQGLQPFKGIVQGASLNEYTMYWQVDGGNQVLMGDNYQDYPHKEASVDLSGWNWKGSGPYVLTFTAKNNAGQVLAQTNRTIYTGDVTTAPAPSPAPSSSTVTIKISPSAATSSLQPPIVVQAPVVIATQQPVSNLLSGNPLAGKNLYVDPTNQASQQVKAWQTSQPTNASLINKIAQSPQAIWLGGWYSDSQTKDKIASAIAAAKTQNAIPTFVLYNIPARDCGSYSAGGINSPEGYRAWVNLIANAIGNNSPIIILEPDALAQKNCLSSNDQTTRLNLIKDAVTILKSKTTASVYIDAGHMGWISSNEMSDSLKLAGVDKANGFALNVSNYQRNSENITYGKEISSKIGNKHFVIDTSRNGNGSNGEWCNPSGRALGSKPTTSTGESLVDAYLWIKNPGESDGECNGGPSAGTWWSSYALGLAERAPW
jgi:endoglucanase